MPPVYVHMSQAWPLATPAPYRRNELTIQRSQCVTVATVRPCFADQTRLQRRVAHKAARHGFNNLEK